MLCSFRSMRRLGKASVLLLTVSLLGWAAIPARADGNLFFGVASVAGQGYVNPLDSGGFYPYSYLDTKNITTNPLVTASGSGEYPITEEPVPVKLEGSSSATSTASPSPASFTSYMASLSNVQSHFNSGAADTESSISGFAEVYGFFILTTPHAYTLSLSAAHLLSGEVSGSYSEEGSTYAYLSGPSVLHQVSTADGTDANSWSGTLQPGTYSFYAISSYSSTINDIIGASGSLAVKGSAEIELSLRPVHAAVPEPASLTLLGVGAAGVGLGAWRRRRSS